MERNGKKASARPKITPCLWFDKNAEEAVKFYTSLFKNSKIKTVTHYGEEAAKGSGQPKGLVMTMIFELNGQEFMALNGGPNFKFSPAISFVVNCDTQKEIDTLWEKIGEEGEEVQCGWITDKFGMSWQIVPAEIEELIQDKDPKKADRVMKAVMGMKKLDAPALKKAYAGKA